MDREEYMEYALELAAQAAGESEIPVGCIIADADGNIIGRGRNKREESHDATHHAEIEAIREACRAVSDWRLGGCTIYVTLEPCPMCAGAIINSRIPTVVFGAKDENTGSCGSVINLFEEALRTQAGDLRRRSSRGVGKAAEGIFQKSKIN